MIHVSAWVQNPPRKLCMRKSPGEISRNQIDYIMFNGRFRNSIKQTKTYPGDDTSSDHNPVATNINIVQKKIKMPNNKEQFEVGLPKD